MKEMKFPGISQIEKDPDCMLPDGSVDYECYLEDGWRSGSDVIHAQGKGAIKESYSLERPVTERNTPNQAVVLPPGEGSINGWSYEVPLSGYKSSSEDNFEGGGGTGGGGGATGSW